MDIYIPSSLFPIIEDEWYYVNSDPDYNHKEISLYSYNPTKNLQLRRYTIMVKGAGAYVAAGSCVGGELPASALAISRAPLVVKPGGGEGRYGAGK